MSNINKHLDNKKAKLNQLEDTLAAIQAQLAQLSQELRVEQQLAKAQESIKKEFLGKKAELVKLLKDACSCYEPDALDDFLLDLQEEITDIKNHYDDHANSDRFYNPDPVEMVPSLPATSTSTSVELPDETDTTTPLSTEQITVVLEELDKEILRDLQTALKVPLKYKRADSIAEQLAPFNVTMFKLKAAIRQVEMQAEQAVNVFALNGKPS